MPKYSRETRRNNRGHASIDVLASLKSSEKSKNKSRPPNLFLDKHIAMKETLEEDKNEFQMVEFADSAESADGSNSFYRGYQMGRPSLVRKGGKYRIAYKGISGKGKHYLQDLYQTCIDLKWRWVMAIVFIVFFISYLLFAIFWFLMAVIHGDLTHIDDPNWTPCIYKLKNFPDALQFSIETQTTIGFGVIYPNPSCIASIPLMYLQATVGFLLETILMGFVLVKLAKSKHRRNTLLFSNTACICKEEGELVLQIRLGDMRQSHLVDTSVYGIFIRDKVSKEGTRYPLFQHHLDIQAHGMDDRVFLIWPLVLNHKINEDSPFWDMKPEEILHANNFEVVVIFEGIIESTGEICQARTSYTSKDIIWGRTFANIVEFDDEHGKWRANFKLFEDLVPCPIPKYSGKEMHILKKALESGTQIVSGKNEEDQPYFRKISSLSKPHDSSMTEFEDAPERNKSSIELTEK
ncbi:hypothetical protein CHS0354_006719 [Potamilus streckersoni]|uniref:Uncharacterized protein n=1 Tax=Potamilus streckersoni TaxID=2493646 RepID=A0AAE0T560_9BIVA|nr:hypothetical protein CHS0354_006719 [Potamilus streckersoni]